MLYCQRRRAHVLHEKIYGGLTSCEDKLNHVGIQAAKRSSLAYANEQWP